MKIDCSITQNFMKEFARMCKYMPNCGKCDMNLIGEYGSVCYEDCMSTLQCERYMTDIQEIVQTWSDLNPQRTYLTDFLEKYPNAALDSDGFPYEICPHTLGLIEVDECDGDGSNCVSCWNQPIQ